ALNSEPPSCCSVPVARYIGVGLLILLQLAIILTGNYAFFNLLALALCLCGLDDRTFAPLVRVLRWRAPVTIRYRWLGFTNWLRAWRAAGNIVLAMLILLAAIQLTDMLGLNTRS